MSEKQHPLFTEESIKAAQAGEIERLRREAMAAKILSSLKPRSEADIEAEKNRQDEKDDSYTHTTPSLLRK